MHERRFQRVHFEADVEIVYNGQSVECELLDIALKGALVDSPTPLTAPLGSICNIAITLPGTTIALDFQAELVHTEATHYGFKFLSEDLETMTHLRKLVELNTGDPESVRNELMAWLQN